MKKKIKTFSIYLIKCVSILLLGLLAFSSPKIAQNYFDKKMIDCIFYTSRSGLDYQISYQEYEMDLKSRLASFAKGISDGKNYVAMFFDYKKSIQKERLEEFMKENLFPWSEAYGMGIEDLYLISEEQIIKSEFYVIYEEGGTEGVAFTCWLIELKIEGELEITLLMDSKDGTIYYMELYNEVIKNLYDNLNVWERMYGWLSSSIKYFSSYYQADNLVKASISQDFIEEENYYSKISAEVLKEIEENRVKYIEEKSSISTSESASERMAVKMKEIFTNLYYGEDILTYQYKFLEEKKQGYQGLFSGILEFKELIPAK